MLEEWLHLSALLQHRQSRSRRLRRRDRGGRGGVNPQRIAAGIPALRDPALLRELSSSQATAHSRLHCTDTSQVLVCCPRGADSSRCGDLRSGLTIEAPGLSPWAVDGPARFISSCLPALTGQSLVNWHLQLSQRWPVVAQSRDLDRGWTVRCLESCPGPYIRFGGTRKVLLNLSEAGHRL